MRLLHWSGIHAKLVTHLGLRQHSASYTPVLSMAIPTAQTSHQLSLPNQTKSIDRHPVTQLSTSTLTLTTFSRGDLTTTTGGDDAFLTFTLTSPLPPLLPIAACESLKTTFGRFRSAFTDRRTLSSSSCTTNNFRQGCNRGINARTDRYIPRNSCECMARGGTMVISVRLGSARSAASKLHSSSS